jgi:hypothetical protein
VGDAVIRDRQSDRARVAHGHPAERVRAAAAYAWLDRRGDRVTVAALRAVAPNVTASCAREVLGLALSHGAGHVRALALRGSYELNPGPLVDVVDVVKARR